MFEEILIFQILYSWVHTSFVHAVTVFQDAFLITFETKIIIVFRPMTANSENELELSKYLQ